MDHEALTYRIDDARRILGLGTTKIYELPRMTPRTIENKIRDALRRHRAPRN